MGVGEGHGSDCDGVEGGEIVHFAEGAGVC